ncbi:flagellar hook-associated protein FlgK [Treponema sp.]|uniref:flagellar hook-associated protein FlgK n=1 Tax=Treponema sp. TaxID=166 RepID=UPI0025EE0A9F|nr:flagellar hook-associated protein FlgK [Treponema sp.]MCR5218312.1 flagellar hook-associated protein FlgK [Treponema sp.]
MGNSFAGIEIGKRSIQAHTTQIQTAGHNISNADTEGYSRQRVIVKSFEPIYRPDLEREMRPGQLGQGTDVESVSRIRDELLESRIVAQTNEETYWETRSNYYSMIENVYNEPDEISVRYNMDKFWEGWQELSSYPESDAARQAVVTRGESLSNSIKQQFNSLKAIRNQVDGDIESTVKQVNDYTRQIAALNSEIVKSKAVGDNPNDLMDRRDLLVEKLSGLINVTVTQKDPDEFMVHTDGQIIVQGAVSRQIGFAPQENDSGYSKLVWTDTKADAVFKGGSLGALVELRDKDLRNQLQTLDTMTLNFADLVNDVHRNSMGKNNVTGLDFFVQHDFVENVNGNYDSDGDGTEDSSRIFRITGTNALKAQEQTGLAGTMTFNAGKENVSVPYYPTDTVEDVINRINDSSSEVKAYLDRNNSLVLKATASESSLNPDFVIRHVEDSGLFLAGYAGILSASGEEGSYDWGRANAVDSLAGAQFAVSPLRNPSAYVEVNPSIVSDVSSVASAYSNSQGLADAADGRAAVEISAIRNTKVMIGKERTFDDYFADTVTEVGLKGEQAENQLASQNKIMEDLRGLRDSISGVNIDEELADIIKFQHGYNAAAKFISVQDALLDTLINRLGV